MDFAAVNLFLMLCYLRPHEWIGLVQSIRLTAFSLVFAIVATFMRERGFTLKSMFRTPHDWMVYFYFGWIILASLAFLTAWKAVYAYGLYYLVAVQALSSLRRIELFLRWWAVVLLSVCLFALASEFGFDPTGAADFTHGRMKGRLVLMLSIFNNPNALGHGVVPTIIMLYFLLIWKRPIFAKIFAIPLMVLPIACLYLTQSKGAFLAAFAGILFALTFGRPKIVQGLIVLAACTVGWGSMSMLPRMHELDRSASDQAIQGRVAAFKFGLKSLHNSVRGLGIAQFEPRFESEHHYFKSSHSAYVEIGAEFGWIGLTLFLGILYCCYRTLLTCRTRTVEEERSRRILFTMLVTHTVSCWMVDFAWRASFFLMVGTIAAFHRQLLGMEQQTVVKEAEPLMAVPVLAPLTLEPSRFGLPEPLTTAGPGVFAMQRPREDEYRPTIINIDSSTEPPPYKGIGWNRIGLLDITLLIIISLAWERLWRYLIHVV